MKKIGVVGAGTMGSAIAQHLAMKGAQVVLVDASEAGLARGRGLIRDSLEEARARKVLADAEVERVLRSIRPVTELGELAGSELVIEAIFEDLDAKRKLLRELESVVGPDCLLATNTSSFLVSEVARGLARAERAFGAHYFYHAAKNKLVELIPGERTAAATMDRARRFYESIGKIVVEAKDAPGFVVNRFFVPWLNEAARLLEEGKGTVRAIDEAARAAFGIGMGPFALMNATGVPIALHAARGLASKLGREYEPCETLRKQAESGKPWDLEGSGGGDSTEIGRRLLGVAVGVAEKLVSEGVADATATDLAARVGLRWPKGPFELARERGIPVSAGIELRFVDSRVKWGCGILELNLPDRMNPLSEASLSEMERRLDDLERDPRVESIVVTGKGKAFAAGADVKFFVDCLGRGELDRIRRFTERGQKVFARLAASRRRTVAYIDGLALGGGLELALACQYRIVTARASLAFPETGIGIYPGLGGTQRTPRLVGKGLAKFLIATGQAVSGMEAAKLGLADELVEPVSGDEELARIVGRVQRRERPIGIGVGADFAAFDGSLPAAFAERDPLRPHEKALRRKAPLALRIAMRLIDEGEKLDLSQALELELGRLGEIFATEDARAGLESLLRGAKPVFVGR